MVGFLVQMIDSRSRTRQQSDEPQTHTTFPVKQRSEVSLRKASTVGRPAF